jgi:hypothetical protein
MRRNAGDMGERVSVKTARYPCVAMCHGLETDLSCGQSVKFERVVGTNNAYRGAVLTSAPRTAAFGVRVLARSRPPLRGRAGEGSYRALSTRVCATQIADLRRPSPGRAD